VNDIVICNSEYKENVWLVGISIAVAQNYVHIMHVCVFI
jgi:hypothetical protein